MTRKTLRTRRLVLRPYRPADYQAWREAHLHAPPRKTRHDWAPKPGQKLDRREFLKVVSRHERYAREDTTYIWPVFEKESGAVVGGVDIYILHRSRLQVANLGYRISNSRWRRGYGKEAVAAVIRAAFRDLGLNRLEAVIDPDNRASIGLARALGLRREGVRRSYYYQDGRWEDQAVYVAIREDFGLKPVHPLPG